jgi:hypothetical protein
MAISGCGCVYGRRWRRASTMSQRPFENVTGSSLVISRVMTSTASSRRSRVVGMSRPIIAASLGSAPGPRPSMKRPFVRWSSMTARSATHRGLW